MLAWSEEGLERVFVVSRLTFFNLQPWRCIMSYEEIHDPIEVITFFKQGELHPLRFKWKGEVYKISRVNSSWSVQEGLSRQYHFSVTAHTPDCFELVFDTADFCWRLARVYLDG